MATSTAISVEEYLRTYYDPDMEYVDGQLVERHVGEHYHSLLIGLVTSELNARRRARRFRVFPDQRIQISNSPRYRIPDILVMPLPYEVTSVLHRPHLVIEVLSPDDEASDTLLKIADYQSAGIPYIWIVDFYKRSLVESVEGGALRTPDRFVLSTPLVGEIDFGTLFAELDEPAE